MESEKPKDVKEPKKNLVKGRPITVLQSNLIETRVQSKYNKFQLWVCKIIGVTPSDNYQYLFRVSFKGAVHVKLNDIIYNSENLPFVVVKTSLRMMVVVSLNAYDRKPLMRGTLLVFKGDKNLK